MTRLCIPPALSPRIGGRDGRLCPPEPNKPGPNSVQYRGAASAAHRLLQSRGSRRRHA